MNTVTSETAVARYMTDTPLPAGPIEVITSENPTACCITLLRAVSVAEEATQTARAENLANQAYRRAFGVGYHVAVPSVEVASLGDLSVRALIDVVVSS